MGNSESGRKIEDLRELVTHFITIISGANMSVLVLQRIPSEVLVHILEMVGKSICQDLITIDFHRGTKSSKAIPYGRHVLGMQVGLPIRERLMDLQMLKFTNFLESVKITQHHLEILRVQDESECQCWPQIDGAGIVESCGFVWKNPLFRHICSQLFHPNGYSLFSRGTNVWLISLLRDVFKKDLVETATSGAEGLVYLKKNETKVVLEGEIGPQLVPLIEFTVGQYEFPHSFPCWLAEFFDKIGVWVGVSVLSYKSYRGDNVVEGEGNEGRYWLWYSQETSSDRAQISFLQYWIIDHVGLLGMDSRHRMYDLRNYGERIEDETT